MTMIRLTKKRLTKIMKKYGYDKTSIDSVWRTRPKGLVNLEKLKETAAQFKGQRIY